MRILLCLLVVVGTCGAEVSCYKTPAQAALQVGEQQGGGYRLETVRRDALGGKNWATVRSCVHPEWPAVAMATGLAVHADPKEAAIAVGNPTSQFAVANGATVRVVMLDGMARIELSGVAQGAGRVGDRVWVRIAPVVEGSEGRLALAVVRSAEILEVGQ